MSYRILTWDRQTVEEAQKHVAAMLYKSNQVKDVYMDLMFLVQLNELIFEEAGVTERNDKIDMYRAVSFMQQMLNSQDVPVKIRWFYRLNSVRNRVVHNISETNLESARDLFTLISPNAWCDVCMIFIGEPYNPDDALQFFKRIKISLNTTMSTHCEKVGNERKLREELVLKRAKEKEELEKIKEELKKAKEELKKAKEKEVELKKKEEVKS